MKKKLIIYINLAILFPFGFYAQDIKETYTDSISFHQSFMSENKVETMSTRGAEADYYGSFTIKGNESTFYPVVFKDNAWNRHRATVLEIGRSSTHADLSWHGSLLSIFRFHLTQWGHGSNFIDADIKQTVSSGKIFIGGWKDATSDNSTFSLIVWLRGNTTYYYNSNYPQTPTFTSSSIVIANTTYNVKTAVDNYVNTRGTSLSNPLWVTSTGSNYFAGNVGVGISNPAYKLDVNGVIRAKEIKVETGWADFVFDNDYKLPSLNQVESHIREYKHLPGIPSEAQVKEEGVNLAEMQVKLLQKIEELTLYVIELKKENEEIKQQLNELKKP